MVSLAESVYLKVLTQGLAHSLWQAALLWAGFKLWKKYAAPRAEAQYYAAATLAILPCLLLPATFGWLWSHDAAATGWASKHATGSWHHWVQAASSYLGVAYLAAMGFMLLQLIVGRRQLQRLTRATAPKAPVGWRLFVQQYAATLGIRQQVQLRISHRVTSPLTLGFWKPVILMPVAMVNQLSLSQAEAILLHELIHIKRHDYLINLLLQCSRAIFFFNPAVRLLVHEASTQRELSCDDWVLQFRYSATDYARALLLLQQHALGSHQLALGAHNQGEQALLHRIRRMVGQPANQPANRRWALALALSLVSVLVMVQPVLYYKYQQRQLATYEALQRLPLYNFQKGHARLLGLHLMPLPQTLAGPAASHRPQAAKAALEELQPPLAQIQFTPEFAALWQKMPELELNQASSTTEATDQNNNNMVPVAMLQTGLAAEQLADLPLLRQAQQAEQAYLEAEATLRHQQQQHLQRQLKTNSQPNWQHEASRYPAQADYQYSYTPGLAQHKLEAYQLQIDGLIDKWNTLEAGDVVQQVVVALNELQQDQWLQLSEKIQVARQMLEAFSLSEYGATLQIQQPEAYQQVMKFLKRKMPKRSAKL